MNSPSQIPAPDTAPRSEVHLRVLPQKPKTRGECADVPRPCPWVSCRHHFGTFQPSLGLGEAPPAIPQETCSLDVAERGEQTLEEIGAILGVCKERVRQIEEGALTKLRERSAAIEAGRGLPATTNEIVCVTAAIYGVEAEEIMGKFGDRHISAARAMTYYIAYELGSLSYLELGEVFDRHHTSIMYNVHVVDERVRRNDPETLTIITRIRRLLEQVVAA